MNTEETAASEDGSFQIPSIDVQNMPIVINRQVDELNKLDEKVKSALKKAREARTTATNAKEKSAGWFQKKEAIEALQTSGYALSEAVCSSAEAHEVAFEFQTKLAEITKYLFALGVSSLAQNRMVVRELELKLKGASAGQLSELARKEVLNVVRQLKTQEDILNKQERLALKVRAFDGQLQSQVEKDVEHDEILQLQFEKDAYHENLLSLQSQKDMTHDELLTQQADMLAKHDVAFRSLENLYLALNKAVDSLQNSQDLLMKNVAANTSGIEDQGNKITELRRDVDDYISRSDKKLKSVFMIAIASLIGTVFLYAFTLG